MSDDSIRDSLSSAFDKVGGTSSASTPPAAVAAPVTPPASQPQAAAPTSTTTPAGAQSTAAVDAARPTSTTTPAPSEGGQGDASSAAPPATPATSEAPKPSAIPPPKAPQSWRPAAREKWAALPAEVQQDITRREREMAVAYQESAQHRKLAEGFQRVVSPFAGMIQAEGGDPFKAVGTLLQTAAALRTAPPAHKAQLVANIVKTYGISIEDLDAALAGHAPPPGQQAQQQPVDPEAMASRIRQEVIQGMQQQHRSTMGARAQQETEAFLASGEAEFMDDVRDDVADMMELAAKRGVALTLKDAYNRAVLAHPDVSKVLKQREQAQQANAAQASTQRARDATSSIRTTPAASPAPKDDSVRGALETAWASASGR
ncbi:hypothetical protein D7X74_30430 [Corallococcus sp. CA047B]|uniref:hypothetical protein n=1 Tax=Corallococcus sp. CA047B TaxID=2316729 RepID=UPI000EA23EF6|nr:hypothetical protein [Corallococcus sp. CA047B]RKH09002.1 hypothetical protein D7X74_30430 [Corallococcus sp. CA047B]